MNLAAAKHFLRDAEKCGGFYGGQVMKWLIAEVERMQAELAASCKPTIADHCSIRDAVIAERQRCAVVACARLRVMGYQLRADDVKEAILEEPVLGIS